MSTKMWFESWFDSPYYHILYKDRDLKEAKDFISRVAKNLFPTKGSLLDACCGKGRHAYIFNKLGFEVDAFDLSSKSITTAKELENESLRFYVHDMRKPFKLEHYQYVVNMFTSFGYFEDENENKNALKSIIANLKPNGYYLMDYLNASYIKQHLVSEENKQLNGINFNINRKIKNNCVIKTIDFEDKGEKYQFKESVNLIDADTLTTWIKENKLTVLNTFGDYELNPFDTDNSKRLIIFAQK